jgi:hypothetical protein
MKRIIIIGGVSLLLIVIGVTAVLLRGASDGIPEEMRIQKMNYYFGDKPRVLSVDNCFGDPWLYEFTVMDVKKTYTARVPWGGYTDYTVKLTYDYLNDREIDRQAVVRTFGTPQGQVYAAPRLVSGNTYVMICGAFFEDETTKYPFLFKKWELDGRVYLYPYFNLETTVLGESEAFVYAEELSVYDENDDKDVIQYLTEHNVLLPQFRYKFELHSFLEKFTAFRQKCIEYSEKMKSMYEDSPTGN